MCSEHDKCIACKLRKEWTTGLTCVIMAEAQAAATATVNYNIDTKLKSFKNYAANLIVWEADSDRDTCLWRPWYFIKRNSNFFTTALSAAGFASKIKVALGAAIAAALAVTQEFILHTVYDFLSNTPIVNTIVSVYFVVAVVAGVLLYKSRHKVAVLTQWAGNFLQYKFVTNNPAPVTIRGADFLLNLAGGITFLFTAVKIMSTTVPLQNENVTLNVSKRSTNLNDKIFVKTDNTYTALDIDAIRDVFYKWPTAFKIFSEKIFNVKLPKDRLDDENYFHDICMVMTEESCEMHVVFNPKRIKYCESLDLFGAAGFVPEKFKTWGLPTMALCQSVLLAIKAELRVKTWPKLFRWLKWPVLFLLVGKVTPLGADAIPFIYSGLMTTILCDSSWTDDIYISDKKTKFLPYKFNVKPITDLSIHICDWNNQTYKITYTDKKDSGDDMLPDQWVSSGKKRKEEDRVNIRLNRSKFNLVISNDAFKLTQEKCREKKAKKDKPAPLPRGDGDEDDNDEDKDADSDTRSDGDDNDSNNASGSDSGSDSGSGTSNDEDTDIDDAAGVGQQRGPADVDLFDRLTNAFDGPDANKIEILKASVDVVTRQNFKAFASVDDFHADINSKPFWVCVVSEQNGKFVDKNGVLQNATVTRVFNGKQYKLIPDKYKFVTIKDYFLRLANVATFRNLEDIAESYTVLPAQEEDSQAFEQEPWKAFTTTGVLREMGDVERYMRAVLVTLN